ncbi:dual 3',5'-cyclic-AMP and -GMP phosphodiesterase 11 [Trichonephila clavipes]|nr:dual 3',5'-cyclic-AMP and -GMP phosphodiesterase 11 [Trichonephila clavipes]
MGCPTHGFLAIRTLQQLAKDEKSRFPLASETLLYDTYMDDIVIGAPDLETAQQLQSQLKDALQSCGMNLHKWSSNSPELLNSSLSSNIEHSFSTDIDLSVKTLGISWKPFEDCFVFKVSVSAKHIYTKREVLSVIAKLYNSLGFLGPVIAKAKVFLQQLWQCKLDWDDVLPNSIANKWREFVTTLKCVEEVKINRFIIADNNVRIVLQGFVDASEVAYGAVVYLQCFLHNGAAKVSILASKSRVAPIQVISIPQLELCACVLLAQLIKKIRSTLRLNISDIVLHTDSTIALAWLNTPANRLKTFVANRVAKVQELTEGFQWNHVLSVLNPADLVSRGLRPCDLPNLRLWGHGPQFLEKGKLSSEETSLSPVKKCEYSKELKTGSSSDIITSSVCVSTNWVPSILSTLLCKNNSYMKIVRIFSYVLRFSNNVNKCKLTLSGPLSATDIDQAETKLIRMVQEEVFWLRLRAYKIFSRRGKCAKLYSDNEKAFVGANKELKRFLKLIEDSDDNLAGFLSAEGIEWKFIPPRAPSFGGLWEASVKSIKYHLKRVVSGSNLTYEEFLTVCIQIEGILNFRPLCPLSSNSDDLNALTPAHFLIGRSMTSVVKLNFELKENALKKWQRITRLVQLIWNKWHRCYLSELQQRKKWQFKKQNVKVGDLVVLIEDNMPTFKWPLGRITEIYSGSDALIRVVKVLCRWLLSVRKNYRQVTYHNWRHAFNVGQMMFALLTITKLWRVFGEVETLSLLIACLCHDLDHRGTNNSFQIKSCSPLGQLYSTSTMEHHHFDQCIMILNSEGNQILSNLSPDDYSTVVHVVEDAILATDLTVYFRRRGMFFHMVETGNYNWRREDNRELLRAMLMTVCDIAAITKPWEIQKVVAEQVASEFFQQGDIEKEHLKIQPIDMMNRDKKDELPLMQVRFIDSICAPVYEAFAKISDKLKPLVDGVRQNRAEWLKLAEAKNLCICTDK